MNVNVPKQHRRQQKEIRGAFVAAITMEQRSEWIATAAYFVSERKQAQGEPPDPVRDWVEAEQEYEARHTADAATGHTHAVR